MTAATWTQIGASTGCRVFCRALGALETAFYWDGVFHGTADTVMHIHLRSLQQIDLASYANVVRAWTSVKRRFPLLVAKVHIEERNPQFHVQEERLAQLLPEEVTYRDVRSFKEADAFVSGVLEGPPPLSSELLARIFILRRTDRSDDFHAIIVVGHCITDMCSTSTLMRTFFDTLSSLVEYPVAPLEERLGFYLPMEDRAQQKHLNAAQLRWRRALGFAIYMVRSRLFEGGHTLPRKFTTTTLVTPARPRALVTTFPPDVSKTVLENCRRHNITLNNASYVISQVAMTRVLWRRYLRGEIGHEEWEYRKRQPMHIYGPFNLRPYLDQAWFNEGGGGEAGINIGFFQYVLPFMPLGESASSELLDGAPSFSSLLSFKRFLHRSNLLKNQSEKLFRHPRFVEISVAALAERVAPSRAAALDYVRRGRKRSGCESAPIDWIGREDPILSLIGSSLGNMDPLVPLEYPLPPTHFLSPLCSSQHPGRAGYTCSACSSPLSPSSGKAFQMPTPTLQVVYWRTHLHTRPGELYLGASQCHSRLQYNVFFDANVFDEDVIREWMEEVRAATLWYLGRPAWALRKAGDAVAVRKRENGDERGEGRVAVEERARL
ncbi:hypothetical protein F5I97DRAFT_1808183 [Phlebopus sp. FC_14]|nr:hypothetical protein F5I97DRAFT_1808183 [Phlebopus sp. FC_14]